MSVLTSVQPYIGVDTFNTYVSLNMFSVRFCCCFVCVLFCFTFFGKFSSLTISNIQLVYGCVLYSLVMIFYYSQGFEYVKACSRQLSVLKVLMCFFVCFFFLNLCCQYLNRSFNYSFIQAVLCSFEATYNRGRLVTKPLDKLK